MIADVGRSRVSVCMATYNGSGFVVEQMRTILTQLRDTDEVVVVDDASSDDTVERIESLGDPRVRIVRRRRNLGSVRAFETALATATGDYLLLADQDDVWASGRVSSMVKALGDSMVVASNLTILGTGEGLRSPFGRPDWRLRRADSRRNIRNIVGILLGVRPYFGCAMGVRREALADLLPMPTYLTETHDLWLALYGNVARSVSHLEEVTIERRLHGGNQTPDRPRQAVVLLRSRLMLVRALLELVRRVHLPPRPGAKNKG